MIPACAADTASAIADAIDEPTVLIADDQPAAADAPPDFRAELAADTPDVTADLTELIPLDVVELRLLIVEPHDDAMLEPPALIVELADDTPDDTAELIAVIPAVVVLCMDAMAEEVVVCMDAVPLVNVDVIAEITLEAVACRPLSPALTISTLSTMLDRSPAADAAELAIASILA